MKSTHHTPHYRFSFKTLAAILLTFWLAASIGEAQIVKGSFVGTVRDASGAALPKAKVTVRNLSTNITNIVPTDDTGSYIVPFLDTGMYSVSAELAGFKTAIEPEVKLDVAARVRTDFTLQVGLVSQTVEVLGAEPLVETDSSAVDLTITSEKLRNIPLVARNYQALALISPTAVSPNLAGDPVTNYLVGLSTGGGYYQVGGQRGGYISYTIDGIDSNALWVQSQGIIPSLDTIQEFKIQSQNSPAEYGRGSVQYTTTTRSGTNALHGSAYEYVKNNILNANDFFANRAGTPISPFRYNQFGFTVGGPIYIPKVYNGKDKSFFFFGYEGTRFRTGSTVFANFPDPAWLTGDFSDLKNPDGSFRQIYDPSTTRSDGAGGFIRDPFPGNIIPTGRFDPVAVATVQFIPTPNAPGIQPGSNDVGTVPVKSNVNYWMLRGDHNFSDRDKLYSRYMQSRENYTNGSLVPLSGYTVQNRGYNVMLGETHTFSPRIVNELRLGYNKSFYGNLQDGANGSVDFVQNIFGIKNIGSGPKSFGLPAFSWTGFSGVGARVDDPTSYANDTQQLSDNLIKLAGKHSLKAGLDIRKQRFSPLYGTNNRGNFSFSGQFSQNPEDATDDSGSPFADFLLGLSNNVTGLAGQATGHFAATSYGFYFQDDWRVSKRLTVNLGLRYEYYGAWTDSDTYTNFQFGFAPGTCFGVNCAPGRVLVVKPGQTYYSPDKNDWAPRIGFSYAPFNDNKTVIRAAYGIFYSPADLVDETFNLFNPPTALNFALTPQNPFTDLTTTKLSSQFPAGAGTVDPATLVTNNWPLPPLSLFATRDFNEARIQEWQLNVQRELRPNLLLEVGYIGNLGQNGARRINFNQARLDNPGELTPIASRLPYPSLSSIMTVSEHTAFNTYDAGTLRLERRFEKGLSLIAAYTYAKTLDDFGNLNDNTGYMAQNAYDPAAEKGLSSFDVRHRFTVGYVWEVPFGRGKSFGSGIPAVLNGVLGGWQLSGITTFQSGQPVKLQPSTDTSNTGQYSFAERPDKVGPVKYEDIRKTGYWFNADAFAAPKLGTFGDSRRGDVIGPGINNWEIAIEKNFRLAESAKLQFRAEMFNAFNHTQFTNAGINGVVGPGLETLTGLETRARPPRSIQLGARLEF